MKRKTMRGGVSPSSAAESPCRPSCSEPRARTVARMVCGTPSTNSPAEACALAVPVAQISPQLWAETHCLGNRGTQHISLLRLDSSVNRYGRPAGNKTNISIYAPTQTSQGCAVQGRIKSEGKGDWKKRTNEKPNRENSRKESSSCRGSRVSSASANLKKSQHPILPNQQRSWRRRA